MFFTRHPPHHDKNFQENTTIAAYDVFPQHLSSLRLTFNLPLNSTQARVSKHLNSLHNFLIRIISRRFSHSREKRLLASSSASLLPPVCVPTYQPRSHWGDFHNNLAFGSSMNICWETSDLVKTGTQKSDTSDREISKFQCCQRLQIAIKAFVCSAQYFYDFDWHLTQHYRRNALLRSQCNSERANAVLGYVIQGDRKVSVDLTITVQSAGLHRLLDHPVVFAYFD